MQPYPQFFVLKFGKGFYDINENVVCPFKCFVRVFPAPPPHQTIMLMRTSRTFFTWKGNVFSCSVPSLCIMSLKDRRQCHLFKNVSGLAHRFTLTLRHCCVWGKICAYCKSSINAVTIKRGCKNLQCAEVSITWSRSWWSELRYGIFWQTEIMCIQESFLHTTYIFITHKWKVVLTSIQIKLVAIISISTGLVAASNYIK